MASEILPKSVSPDLLSSENSMWKLYRLSFSFPVSKFNVGVFVICFSGLLIFGLANFESVSILSGTIRAILGFGISIAPSILGFLVAGFTIFVTVTKVELFEFMALKRYKQTEHSYLKYNMSAFMLAFCHYITYLIVCAILVIFAQPLGPLVTAVKYCSELFSHLIGYNVYCCLLILFLAVFGSWTIYLLMLLKSFIFNTYHVLITSVQWGLMEKARARATVQNSSTPK